MYRSLSFFDRARTHNRMYVAALYEYTSAKHSHSLTQDKHRVGINQARNKTEGKKNEERREHRHHFVDNVCMSAQRASMLTVLVLLR